MAGWLSRNDYVATDKVRFDMFNSLANDDRNWGGDVNGGGHRLSNVFLDGSGGFQYYLSPLQVTPGADGQSNLQLDQTVGGNNVARWTAGKTNTAETGGNAGSDYAISRFNDAGVLIDTPFAIQRSTGIIVMGPQMWTGPINGNGQTLSNVTIPGVVMDPTETFGDLIVRGHATVTSRLGVGSNGQVLTADSGQPLGMYWATPASGIPPDDTSVQKVRFSKDGVLTGTRHEINFITGSNVVLTALDDGGNNRVNLTISSTGSGGGGSQTPWLTDIDAALHGLNNLGFLSGRSGAAGTNWVMQMGRTAADATIAVPASAGQFAGGAAAGDLVIRTESAANNVLIGGGGGTTAFFKGTGIVGIGTTNPQASLDVTGSGVFRGAAQQVITSSRAVRIGFDSSGGGLGDILAYDFGTAAYMPLSIRGNPTYFTAGNVGIGTASPQSTLHVQGSQVRWTPTGGALDAGLLCFTGNASAYIELRSGLSSDFSQGRALVLNGAGGNVGIATANPRTGLDVNGTIRAGAANGGGGGLQVQYYEPNNWGFIKNQNLDTSLYGLLALDGNPLVLNTNVAANVGIGVSPAYKLDVAGDVNCTGAFRVNGVPIGAGGSQTPWASNIDAAIHRLQTVGNPAAAAAFTSSSLELREAGGVGGGQTSIDYSPRLSFHWSGIVAAQIGMDSSGVIRAMDGAGTGFATFAANIFQGSSALLGTPAVIRYTASPSQQGLNPNTTIFFQVNEGTGQLTIWAKYSNGTQKGWTIGP